MSDESRIPSDCLNLLFTYVPHEDKTTTRFIALLADNYTDTELLAQQHSERVLASHVARSEQAAATAMLTLNPELALESTDVIGYTQLPVFVDTAVKYAAWARDHKMLWMIIDQITAVKDITKRAELITELLKQFNEIPERFSLKPLMLAYRNYPDKYADADARRCSWDDVDTAWLAIGVEQSKLPANYAQYYCDPNLPLYPCPDANQLDSRAAGLRSEVLDFDNYSTGVQVAQHWYTGAGLGLDFTLACARVRASAGAWRGRSVAGDVARCDLAAIEALDTARTAEIEIIRVQLTQLLHNAKSHTAVATQPHRYCLIS